MIEKRPALGAERAGVNLEIADRADWIWPPPAMPLSSRQGRLASASWLLQVPCDGAGSIGRLLLEVAEHLHCLGQALHGLLQPHLVRCA